MSSTKTLHVCQKHTAHLQRKWGHIWQSQEKKSAVQWPSHGHLCGTRLLFFPVWVLERLFLSSVSVCSSTGLDFMTKTGHRLTLCLNSAARQLQASCPHTCKHPHKEALACMKYVDAAGYATFMCWKNLLEKQVSELKVAWECSFRSQELKELLTDFYTWSYLENSPWKFFIVL